MRLHLGCGKKILQGYINMDATCGDVQGDIRDLSAYQDNSVEEILAVHVWEHLWVQGVISVAREWLRVLIPGGKLILEMPSREKVFYLIRSGVDANNLTLWAMFGDPNTIRTEQDLHKWLWSSYEVRGVLQAAGFKETFVLEPEYHVKIRDMRVEAIK